VVLCRLLERRSVLRRISRTFFCSNKWEFRSSWTGRGDSERALIWRPTQSLNRADCEQASLACVSSQFDHSRVRMLKVLLVPGDCCQVVALDFDRRCPVSVPSKGCCVPITYHGRLVIVERLRSIRQAWCSQYGLWVIPFLLQYGLMPQ
jgi:hypothetical protein